MESLTQLIYVSTAAADTDVAAVQRILDVARRHDATHGISGALLVYGGHFLQVLEAARRMSTRCMRASGAIAATTTWRWWTSDR